MLNSSRRFSLPPVALAVPEKAEDALTQCAQGESPPEIALMQFLVNDCCEGLPGPQAAIALSGPTENP